MSERLIILKGLPPENELELLGEQMRHEAIEAPCSNGGEILDRRYFKFIGLRYNVSLTLEVFKGMNMGGRESPPPPRWHCSITVMQDIKSGDDGNFGVPEQAITIPDLWQPGDMHDAREIMGYLLGPVLVTREQPIQEIKGLFAYHWQTPASQHLMKVA